MIERYQKRAGDLPIMLRSNHCWLKGLSPKELVDKHEEAAEFGGTFLCNGIERIVRLIQLPRRNHPMAVRRAAYRKRGPLYTDMGVSMRCCRPDQSSITNTLHYLSNGQVG